MTTTHTTQLVLLAGAAAAFGWASIGAANASSDLALNQQDPLLNPGAATARSVDMANLAMFGTVQKLAIIGAGAVLIVPWLIDIGS